MCMYTVCACIGHLHYRYSNLMLLTNVTALGMYTYSTLLKLHILFHSYPDKMTVHVARPGFVVTPRAYAQAGLSNWFCPSVVVVVVVVVVVCHKKF